MELVHPMNFAEFEERRRFQEAWEAVRIARNVHYSLFTFGESELPYFLVCEARQANETVTITRGDVRITRPLIITPDNIHPEFRNFFEDEDEGTLVDFILRRTAAFSHLTFENQHGPERIVTDSMEEAVSRLNRQLDNDDEDRVAILCAPRTLAGFAVFRYAAERVMKSAPENIQELRERGLLP
jgi:hypothetical protein